ncbi:hypothetical protein G6F23_007805 [Rhizopus arrhizus]|nr:hypothetical protein G6F23_007805 [Rhizopus arrhizus]
MHLVNIEGLNIAKPLNKRRKKHKRPDNVKTAYACPNCTDYYDTGKEFEGHYNKDHLSVNKTTLYGPKFKYTDIVRLQPVVRMAIECNPDIYEEDAALIQENQENQRTLRTLSQYAVQISLIRECLTLNHANEILLLVWTRALEDAKE